ncbi:MAG: transcription termination factor NusA [Oscillospiraceae bacterium]|jgi:N utilization substance protein A|nr:transcription termination factor NusA [Oscillospiraceae bacterium]
MNAEVFAALDMLEVERNIPKEYMLEKLKQAMFKAVKEQMKKAGNPAAGEGAEVELDGKNKVMRVYIARTVVADDEPEEEIIPVTDETGESENFSETVVQAEGDEAAEEIDEDEPYYIKPRRNRAIELTLEEARAVKPDAEIGDVIREELDSMKFGRIAAQAAKSVVIQAIREAERGMLADAFSSKEHQLLSGQVHKVDSRAGLVFIKVSGMGDTGVGEDTAEAVLPPEEQVRGEDYQEGQRLKVYLIQVNRDVRRGPQVIVSRTHMGLVRRLMELEIPEVAEGVVEIKAIAREPGLRTKVAVFSNDPAVDAVGACIGERGQRIDLIVKELRGEKIDIIPYYDDAEKFIGAALAPAEVYSVVLEAGTKKARVVAPDAQLSLAIGKEGKNAKLAAKLTGYKIDIRPASEAVDRSRFNTEQFQALSALLNSDEEAE